MIDYVVSMINANSFLPLLQVGANPMRVRVIENSKLTSWPVEDGTVRTDHRVIEPVEIEIPLLISSLLNRVIFEELRQAYILGDEISVQTKMRTYDSMMIVEMPHENTTDQFGAIPVVVRLKEVVTVAPEFGELPPSKVSNKGQSSTANRGGQQTTDADLATQKKSSILYGLVN